MLVLGLELQVRLGPAAYHWGIQGLDPSALLIMMIYHNFSSYHCRPQKGRARRRGSPLLRSAARMGGRDGTKRRLSRLQATLGSFHTPTPSCYEQSTSRAEEQCCGVLRYS